MSGDNFVRLSYEEPNNEEEYGSYAISFSGDVFTQYACDKYLIGSLE